MKSFALALLIFALMGCVAAPTETFQGKPRKGADAVDGDSEQGDADGCVPVCAQRACGNDPVCGTSCGECTLPATCSVDGGCEEPADPDGPRIASLLTNVTTLAPGSSVVFTAVVTDPQGAADVAGGSLTTPAGNQAYGAFASLGSSGSFSLTLSWAQINAVSTIEFESPAGIQRTFRAVFYDQAAHAVAHSVSVTLDCQGASDAACAGTCVNLAANTNHCGACGRSLPQGEEMYCEQGAGICVESKSFCNETCSDYLYDAANCGQCGKSCEATGANENSGSCHEGRCSARFESASRTSCDAICQGQGRTCEADDYVWAWYLQDDWAFDYAGDNWTCATVAPATLEAETTFLSMSCPCHEPATATCTPSCQNKLCGTDGCGGQCGGCAPGKQCNAGQTACVF